MEIREGTDDEFRYDAGMQTCYMLWKQLLREARASEQKEAKSHSQRQSNAQNGGGFPAGSGSNGNHTRNTLARTLLGRAARKSRMR